MDPKWHIAFCNVTYTEYAGTKYRDYHDSAAVRLDAELRGQPYQGFTYAGDDYAGLL